jgi:glutamate 5-kinase
MYCIQTIVIKIGSAVINNEDKTLNTKVVTHLAQQIAELYEEGHQVILVSSGAVAAGRGICDVSKEKRRKVRRQIYAGLGQAKLMWKYSKIFEDHEIPISQCLITRDNFADRNEFENLITTLEACLKYRIIPIINENDIIANNGVNFGGNDLIAALIAAAVKADKLIILSDIDAFHDKDPNKNVDAKAIHVVDKVTEEIMKSCGGSSSSMGLGGMIPKMQAIKIASEAGVKTFLGKGTAKKILHDLVDTKKPVGTYFRAQATSKKNKRFKHWLKYCALPTGTISIDDGAAKAVNNNKSLLMVGIKEWSDGFHTNDSVYIMNEQNEHIAIGKVNYSSSELREARKSGKDLKVIVHVDNLSLEY